MASATCGLLDLWTGGVVANDPYVRCEARTLVCLETEEEADMMVSHHGPGSIFWSADGKLTQTAKNLYIAVEHGLGYDLAAETFVCKQCRSSCRRYKYFIDEHAACAKLVEESLAYIKHGNKTFVKCAFPIMPAYATKAQETKVLEWMEETMKCIPAHCYKAEEPIHIHNARSGETEVRIRVADARVDSVEHEQEKITVQAQQSTNPIQAHKTREIKMRTENIINLVDSVTKLCAKHGKKLEIVDSKGHKRYPKIPLKHTMGYRKSEWDPHHDVPERFRSFVETYKEVAEPICRLRDEEIGYGWSGVVLTEQDLPGKYAQQCVDGLFIVLGRCACGQLQNALKVTCDHGLRWYGDLWINENIPKYHAKCDGDFEEYFSAIPTKIRKVLKVIFDIHNRCCKQCTQEWRSKTHREHMKHLRVSLRRYLEENPDTEIALFREFVHGEKNDTEPSSKQLGGKPLQLVDVWRTMQSNVNIPNRKIYMGMFTDPFGNFDFFPNSSMPMLFPMYMEAVTHRLVADGTVETNYRTVDKKGELETSMESLYPAFDGQYWNKVAKAVHREQPLHECGMMVSGRRKIICHWEGEVPLYNPVIRATPSQLSFGFVSKLLYVNDKQGRHTYVPKNGYCYLYLFACAMIFCTDSNRVDVATFVMQACERLGPWPKFKQVLFELNWMVTYYGCYDAVVPTILIDHLNKTMHVPSPYGIKQSGMHILRVDNLRSLVELDSMGEGPMRDYAIGGFKETIKGMVACVKSRREFIRKLNNDGEWLVDMMLSPSTLFALGGLLELHGIMLEDVGESMDKMAALLTLKSNALKLAPYWESEKRVREYMNRMVQMKCSINLIVPTEHMRAEKMVNIDNILRALREEQTMMVIDRVDTKQKMLVEQDLLRAECVYNELFSSVGYLNFHGTAFRLTYSGLGRRVGETLENLRNNWFTRWIRNPMKPDVSSSKAWLNVKKLGQACGITYAWVCQQMLTTVLQIVIISLLTVFGSYVLKKVLKMLKWEKQQQDKKLVEYQGKAEEAWITKALALMYLVSTLFSMDLSSALYSNLVKFRTIFDILRANAQYQDGVYEALERQLGNVPAFHEITLYDHEATTQSFPIALNTFDKWYHTRMQSGQQGVAPLDGRHTELQMTKDTVCKTASSIMASKEREFLIIGSVGCGKSTSFPAELGKNGRVLICEPTRVLVTNLQDSMMAVKGFNISAMMRNYRVMTASNITVTTYGYALHYLYNNSHKLDDYDYILFDEVHQSSAEMYVLYNWLSDTTWNGKIVKLTATAKNVSGDMNTREDLCIKNWPLMDVKTFMYEQGKSTAHDACQLGKVVIVFLTSFREIDESAEILSKTAKIGVIKADSRHLRNKTSLSEDIDALPHEFKYILATNILQNGVNVEADVVVDFGYKIVPKIDCDNRMIATERQCINKADRVQRLGRVGRMKAGYARKIGNGVETSCLLDEVTATEAALLAFGLGVAPVMTNVDIQTFGKVTAEQVRTASKFESQLSYMVWMVNKDGTMATHLYDQFKALLLTQGHMQLSPYYSSLFNVNNFHTIGRYVDLGYMRTEAGHQYTLPFHNREVSDEFAVRIGEAFNKSKLPNSVRMRIPAVDYKEVSLRLQATPGNLGAVLQTVESALCEEKEKLMYLTDALAMQRETFCSVLAPNLNLPARLQTSIARIQDNVSKLEITKRQLEKAVVTYDHEELMKLLHENPSIAAHVSYQAGHKAFVEDIILEKRQYKWMPYVAIGTACAIAITTFIALYYRRMKASVKYEGKAGRIKDQKRQAGRDEKMQRESAYTYCDTGDSLYDGVQEWNNNSPDWSERIRKKTHQHSMQFGQEAPARTKRSSYQFWHFYGFDPAIYDSVEFRDIASGFSVTQKANAYDLEEAFNQIYMNRRTDDDWEGPYLPTDIRAIFRKGDAVREVRMAPHKPNQANKRGLPVGYAEKRGEWRQVEPSEEKPANFENASTFEGPRSFKHIHQNQVMLVHGTNSLYGLIVGNILFTPYHFTRRIEDGAEVESRMLTQFGTFNLGKVTSRSVTKFTMMDLVALTLPPSFQPRRKLKCFRLPVEGERAILLATRYEKGDWVLQTSAETPIVPFGERHDAIWKHKISTSEGDCGSLIVAVSDQKIVGFHNLGGLGENYFTPITTEVMDFLAEKSELPLVPWKFSKEQVDLCGLIVQNDKSTFPFSKTISGLVHWQSSTMLKYCGENFKALGYAPNHMSKRHVVTGRRPEFIRFLDTNQKWRTIVEPLSGEFQPSVLTREAYYKDMLKYNKDIMVGTVMEESFAKAVVSTIDMLRIAGFERNGCKAIFSSGKIFNDLNLDAAMGALYTGKKLAYFSELTDEEIDDFYISSAAKLLGNGHGVWSGLLKAELRPKAKVSQGKTRTFTSAPVDILMGAKSVVDDFNKLFYSRHLRGPWTVGINKFNGGWNLLAGSLTKHEWYIGADGSQFDSSITPLLMNAILNIRQYFMEDDEDANTMLANLYTQIINTCILIEDGTIVQKYRGNNSGQPSTVVDNTMCLIIAMEYCRDRVWSEHGVNMSILYVCNGDDLLINANEEDKEIIQKFFSGYMKELELNYSFDEAYKSIEDVEYMSHKFMKRENMYIPKLKRERIIAILEWQRSKEPKAIQSAIIAAYVEAFGYDDLSAMIEEFAQTVAATWTDFKLPTKQEVEDLYIRGVQVDLQDELREVNAQYCVFEAGVVDEGDEALKAALADEGARDGKGTVDASGDAKSSGTSNQKDQEPEMRDEAPVVAQGQRPRGNSFVSNPVKPTDDVPEKSPGLVFPKPKPTSKAIYVPSPVRALLRPEFIGKMVAYQPKRELVENRYASMEQLSVWMKEAADGLGVSEDVFVNAILPGWIFHCIINTTSPSNEARGTWRAVNNAGTPDESQVEYPIAPMYKAAKPTLRAIMRNFGDAARVMIQESVRIGRPIIPRAFDKSGVLSIDNIIASVDFIVRNERDNSTFVQVQNNVVVNRLKNIQSSLFGQASLGAGSNEDTSRHDADDVRENTHSFRGANAFA
ncbi:polyprotein [Yellow oat-grass mosaic virus]|uniref:Genome polyprotein n=2 Tax=Yellow oat-grass mosaic virus TaxID=2170240 RepID=A0A068LEM1_9POTY|nr:polyprotein [Yellow oat grass mosaic virus]AIE45539.1 polyprotein [Yellow oat grass mosaic virus]